MCCSTLIEVRGLLKVKALIISVVAWPMIVTVHANKNHCHNQPERRSVSYCTSCVFLFLFYFLNFLKCLLILPACTYNSMWACIHLSFRDILCLYLCVYSAGRMNPNEIFYGPVDLLIVPQVLSLLTPNLLETTCWDRFFYLYPLFLPSSLFIPPFFLFFVALPQGDL